MTGRPWIILGCHAAFLGIAAHAAPARAQSLPELASKVEKLNQDLQAQRQLIDEQSARIEAQRQEIDRLRNEVLAASSLSAERAAGVPEGQSMSSAPAVAQAPSLTQAPTSTPSAPLPSKPVGEAPEIARVETQVKAVPEGAGVLTHVGHLVIEPSFDYSTTSNNRLVFRGVELIPGIQFGVIEANDVARNFAVGTLTARYGLAKNLEFEARVPFLLRWDRYDFVQQRDNQIVRTLNFDEQHLGDIEFAVRYQINRPVGEKPIFIASVRVKTDTGKSPYEIPYDQFGIATGLATGSGFWAVQPGMNVLLPSDPAVIYGGVSYLWHLPKNINRQVGDVFVGRVDPGDAILANIGFGFALNQRFSFSLGYRHTVILPTDTEVGSTHQRSTTLQVGALTLGMAYRVTERQTLNLGIDMGVTADAPDVDISLRIPFNF
jgi:hypothetical protein